MKIEKKVVRIEAVLAVYFINKSLHCDTLCEEIALIYAKELCFVVKDGGQKELFVNYFWVEEQKRAIGEERFEEIYNKLKDKFMNGQSEENEDNS